MTSAPKIDNVCQMLGLATIIANTGTTMERPIISPATKLLLDERLHEILPGGSSRFSLIVPMMATILTTVGALAHLLRKKSHNGVQMSG